MNEHFQVGDSKSKDISKGIYNLRSDGKTYACMDWRKIYDTINQLYPDILEDTIETLDINVQKSIENSEIKITENGIERKVYQDSDSDSDFDSD